MNPPRLFELTPSIPLKEALELEASKHGWMVVTTITGAYRLEKKAA